MGLANFPHAAKPCPHVEDRDRQASESKFGESSNEEEVFP
jgi:hypothetical protein